MLSDKNTPFRIKAVNTQAHLNGEHIVTRMNGLYLITGTQHVDNHTAMDHAKPNCNSYEVYKGILDGHSHAVFNGKVFVRKDAQETDAKQLNKNLLLSPTASVDTKPQLEIFADQEAMDGADTADRDLDESLGSAQALIRNHAKEAIGSNSTRIRCS